MGEKPVRGLKKAASHMSMKHVKVYRLKDNGKWDDQGTGHVTIDYIEGSRNIALIVVDEDSDILLLHSITPDGIYKKQETIISWRDPEKALELALSFEGPAACSYIWDNICNIREGIQSKILHSHEGPNPTSESLEPSGDLLLHDKSLSSVNGEFNEEPPVEFFSSKRKKYSQPLPPLELSSLCAILKHVRTILDWGLMDQMHAADSVYKEERGAALQQIPNMSPETPMTLLDLPPEMLEEVIRWLPCRVDRAHLRCCNKFWRDAIKKMHEPLQLPWLLFPSSTELFCYSVTGNRFQRLHQLPVQVLHARFSGASDGEWLFLVSDNPPSHELFNLLRGKRIRLPVRMGIARGSVDVIVKSAVVSGNPDSGGLQVAAIVDMSDGTRMRAAFWQTNMNVWQDCGNVAWQRNGDKYEKYLPLDMELVDLVHIRGTFWYLTSEEEVVTLVPEVDRNGQLHMVARGLKVDMREDFEDDEVCDEEEVFEKGTGNFTWRYLVELSGQLIMLVRYIEGRQTTAVRLFRLQSYSEKTRWRWDEILELPGEALFIGHGCSRSYKTGRDILKVYFFHDRITRMGNGNHFWRTDSGMATHLGVLKWPVLVWNGVPMPATSDRAPLVWLLH